MCAKKRTTILLCFSIDAQNPNYEAVISNYTLRLQLNQATGHRQQLQIGLVTVWQVGKGVTLTHNINSIHKWQHEVANELEHARMQHAWFLMQVKLSRCQVYFRGCRTAALMRGLHIQITLLSIQLFMLRLSIKVAEYIGGSIIRFPLQHHEGKVIT